MFTLFHLFRLVSPVLGLLLGFSYGRHFGTICTLIEATLGCYLGFLIGRLPDRLSDWFMFRQLKSQSTSGLWSDLQDEGCLTPNHVLLELRRRGELMEQALNLVLSMLISNHRPRRLRGYAALLSGFPELAGQTREYNPDATEAERHEFVNALKSFVSEGGGKAT